MGVPQKQPEPESYRQMYCKLFNACTDMVKIIQNVQSQAEDMYLSEGDKVIDLEPYFTVEKEIPTL